jgi:ribonuclease P protein component
LVLFLPGKTSCSRFGITVSRKVGNSVVRNRVKRQLREGIRCQRAALVGRWDVVLIANPRAASIPQEVIAAEVCSVFTQLNERSR